MSDSIDDLRAALFGQAKKPAEKIATVKQTGGGEIDVTEDVIQAFTQPVVDEATKTLKPVLLEVVEEQGRITSSKLEADLQTLINEELNKAEQTLDTRTKASTELVDSKLIELSELAQQVRPIEIVSGTKRTSLKGVSHEKFELLLHIIGAKLPVFMVGPAGTGKTKGAEDAAEALGIDFYAISVGSQTSKSDIFGYKDATGNYHSTAFRDAYEKGGVFLLDEADAGNANVLVGLNAALSNGYVYFPDKVVKMHDDFRMVATANTFGNGASRQYVGRNQLDAATLDRFTVITWDIDKNIEQSLAFGTEGKRWLKVVRAVRHKALDEMDLRVVVSPRATLRGATLLGAGVDVKDVIETALIANMPEAEREVLRNHAQATWDKGAVAVRATRKKAEQVEDDFDLDSLKTEFDGEDD